MEGGEEEKGWRRDIFDVQWHHNEVLGRIVVEGQRELDVEKDVERVLRLKGLIHVVLVCVLEESSEHDDQPNVMCVDWVMFLVLGLRLQQRLFPLLEDLMLKFLGYG